MGLDAPVYVSAVAGNSQRLDGGAMFGNAPRALWSRWCPPDEENRIPLACRALLVEWEDRRVLLEAGIGTFFPPRLRARYGVVEQEHVLLRSLAELGLSEEDITDVILSHLHFDHAGGVLAPHEEGRPPRLLFPRARFFVSEAAFERAEHPHPRDRASFIPELQPLLRQSGRLCLLRDEQDVRLPRFRLRTSHGHTPGLLLSEVQGQHETVLFVSDLVPGRPWVHLPITMGYDRFPELLIDEKAVILGEMAARGGWVFYTHDPEVAMSRILRTEDGRLLAVEPQTEVRRRPI
ncbi:MAG: MBL fold metallo-hydrolase [Myxococcales bacterium]|nr:MBL fold metallo-hydrolase [Myxococcota bacterium]MDW8280803.1 MBL fold metallo-hydrolase [Myxococcales bacterium]